MASIATLVLQGLMAIVGLGASIGVVKPVDLRTSTENYQPSRTTPLLSAGANVGSILTNNNYLLIIGVVLFSYWLLSTWFKR